MYQVKNRIYQNFDKTQKAAICNFLRALVKQNLNLSSDDLLDKFLEDEKYYIEIKASRFPFLEEVIDDTKFLSDTKLYIKECIKYYEYKEKQRPIIEAQKEFERKKRVFLRELKMSKEEPTKKQLYYYDKLCKKYSIEKNEEKIKSKLEIRNEIERILNEHSEDNRFIN